jgi:hypothetical protein
MNMSERVLRSSADLLPFPRGKLDSPSDLCGLDEDFKEATSSEGFPSNTIVAGAESFCASPLSALNLDKEAAGPAL